MENVSVDVRSNRNPGNVWLAAGFPPAESGRDKRVRDINPLNSKGNYSATSNNTKLVP